MRAKYHVSRSNRGFRIALAQLPESECVAVSFHIPRGGRHDPDHLAGLAHFVEHMSFKGTSRRTAKQISIEAEDAGASLNAYTSEDQTNYEGRGDAESFPLLSNILSDMVWHSNFPSDEMELERDVIAEEIVMYHETPSDHISDLLSQAAWSPHPLGQPITGTLDSINQIGREELKAFARHHLDPSLVISVAGPFEMSEVLDTIEILTPAAGPGEQGQQTPPPARSTRSIVEPRETAQVQLALGYHCSGRHDPRRHAIRLLASILGEGASSRLFQKLREERGLCYQISCDVTFLDETGLLEIHAGLDPSHRDEAIDCIRLELMELATSGPIAAETERAKKLVASQTRAAMESTSAHAGWIGDCVLHHDLIISPRDALAQINRVSCEEIQAVAREILRPENEAMAEIHPA